VSAKPFPWRRKPSRPFGGLGRDARKEAAVLVVGEIRVDEGELKDRHRRSVPKRTRVRKRLEWPDPLHTDQHLTVPII
jgi:hypothetical protein